ncbi:hypothetical protein [Halarcobacter bivalviorum]|uniref:Uncharacterized protein n=1 Tax=Halarcobacter bivalviorum TaxID=663364 RepID=A0AAX2A932_9BACT|nr:hypothetical protein [Halarcobacter bivalviorum]AXH12323.1 hypothetical protein ABIV_1327 [Halarcobacter bivalviorum]RXK10744.1 hypothetical protein CRV05_05560 [Halarcobacter bivalviorum]
MILLLNKDSLFSTFGVNTFQDLDLAISSMAPSMVDYYLSDLSNGVDDTYLNKRSIQDSISIGEFSIYLDYDDEVYLEIEDNLQDFETGSLW